MSKRYNYTTGNLLEYSYYQNYYKFIYIDLSRQKYTTPHQQINFIGKLGEDHGVTKFSIIETLQKTIPNLPLDPLNVTELYKQGNLKKVLNVLNERSNYGFLTRITMGRAIITLTL